MCWNKRNWIRISREKERSVPKIEFQVLSALASPRSFIPHILTLFSSAGLSFFLTFDIARRKCTYSCKTVDSLLTHLVTGSFKINGDLDSMSDSKTIGFVFTTQQIDLPQPADGKSLSMHKVACKKRCLCKNVKKFDSPVDCLNVRSI